MCVRARAGDVATAALTLWGRGSASKGRRIVCSCDMCCRAVLCCAVLRRRRRLPPAIVCREGLVRAVVCSQHGRKLCCKLCARVPVSRAACS